VHEGRTIYDLEIFSVYQKCLGPDHPEPEQIVRWLTESEQTRVGSRCPSPLRFRGDLEPTDPRVRASEFGHWSVVPGAGRLGGVATAPRWQWWRLYRGVWAPAACAGHGSYRFGCSEQALEFLADGETIARWEDWTGAVREQLHNELSPHSGQYLLIRRDVVDDFARASSSTFCWVCRIRGYHRQYDDQDYEGFSLCQTFGALSIATPGRDSGIIDAPRPT
jgi:hypothetical protein